MTELIRTIAEWRRHQDKSRSTGLVTTMGALHAGHASLMKRARAENDLCILSVFVNPTQFNDAQDFDSYPQNLEADLAIAKEVGVDILFAPSVDEMYPTGKRFSVTETEVSLRMEGVHRPGHFDGMLTIVLKLLSMIQPTRTYFGEKDYQQYVLVRDLAKTFLLDCEVVPCATVREPSGLAMSSRNTNLSDDERAIAPKFHQALLDGDLSDLENAGFEVEYMEEWEGRRFGAAQLGKVRLIDNVPI